MLLRALRKRPEERYATGRDTRAKHVISHLLLDAEAKTRGHEPASADSPGGLRVAFKRYGASTKELIDRAVAHRRRHAPEDEEIDFRRRIPRVDDFEIGEHFLQLRRIRFDWQILPFLLAAVLGLIAAYNTRLALVQFGFILLGIALYFLLANVMGMFAYLKLGISFVLGFVGVKMLLADTRFEISTYVSLGVIFGVLAAFERAFNAGQDRAHRGALERQRPGRHLIEHDAE